MIAEYKVIQIFCIIDEFNKNFNAELDKNLFYHSLMHLEMLRNDK